MTRSQLIATAVITLTVAFLVALFVLSGGSDEIESLAVDGQGAEAGEGAD